MGSSVGKSVNNNEQNGLDKVSEDANNNGDKDKQSKTVHKAVPNYVEQKKRFEKTNALYLIIVSSKKTDLQSIVDHPQEAVDSDVVFQDVNGMQQLLHVHRIESVQHCIYFNTKTNNRYTDLQREIAHLFSDQDANSVLLYFNGHGNQDGTLHFNTNVDYFSFSLTQLLQLWQYRSPNIKHLLVILDCCFSGKWVEQLNQLREPSISVLASCHPNQTCTYTDGIGSFFSDNLQKTYIEKMNNLKLDYKFPQFQPMSYSLDYSKLFYYYNFYVEQITGWDSYIQIRKKLCHVLPKLIAKTKRGNQAQIDCGPQVNNIALQNINNNQLPNSLNDQLENNYNEQNQFGNSVIDGNVNDQDEYQQSGSMSVKKQVNMIKRECIQRCNEYLERLNINQRWVYFKDIYLAEKRYAKSDSDGCVIYIQEYFYKFRQDYNQGENIYYIAQELFQYWQKQVESINKLIPLPPPKLNKI